MKGISSANHAGRRALSRRARDRQLQCAWNRGGALAPAVPSAHTREVAP